MKKNYKESGYFQHNGNKYDINKIFKIVSKKPSRKYHTSDLKWILKHTRTYKNRVIKADLNVPIIVTKFQGKLLVVDGVHRLTKAIDENNKLILGKYITKQELELTKLSKRTNLKKNPYFDLIDNKKGIGVTSLNKEVDMIGIRVFIKPSMFLTLAEPLPNGFARSEEFLTEQFEVGNKIASPSLVVIIPPNSNAPLIDRHQGRNRMFTIYKLYGDVLVETHLFFRKGISKNDKNAGLIDPEMARTIKRTKNLLNDLNVEIISEKGELIKGPWFYL